VTVKCFIVTVQIATARYVWDIICGGYSCNVAVGDYN
jgi:hypothetical protein